MQATLRKLRVRSENCPRPLTQESTMRLFGAVISRTDLSEYPRTSFWPRFYQGKQGDKIAQDPSVRKVYYCFTMQSNFRRDGQFKV